MTHPNSSKRKIKLFSDGADLTTLLQMAKDPKIDGLTTNPSLMKKAGVKDYRLFCREILDQVKDKPVSFEVCADTLSEIRRQALELASWGENVYVKIPVINSEGVSLEPLIRELSSKNVKLNVTALLTLGQVFTTARALSGGPSSIISVFAGRIADVGCDPIPMMFASKEICSSFSLEGNQSLGSKIELLWASTREVFNVVQAEQCGADIITVPPEMIKKLSFFGKDLAQISLETVQTFKDDALAAGFKF